MQKILLTLCMVPIFSLNVYAQTQGNYTVFDTDHDIIYALCFTEKGEALGIGDHNSVKVYSIRNKELLNEFKNGHSNRILSIDISKDSTLLASGGKDSTIVIWNFANGEKLKTLTFQKGIVTSVRLSPDGKYLLSGGTDNKAYLFDLNLNRIIREFVDHTDDITSVAFSPDGRLMATASADKLINVYEVENNEVKATLTGHKSWVRDIAFSGDGTQLISCGDDSRLITWDVTDIGNVRLLSKDNPGLGWILSVNISGPADIYAYGSVNGKARIVTPIGSYRATLGKPINKVLLKPNKGKYLAIALATRGRGVMLIEAEKMKFKK